MGTSAVLAISDSTADRSLDCLHQRFSRRNAQRAFRRSRTGNVTARESTAGSHSPAE
jgi:hypothetical protein